MNDAELYNFFYVTSKLSTGYTDYYRLKIGASENRTQEYLPFSRQWTRAIFLDSVELGLREKVNLIPLKKELYSCPECNNTGLKKGVNSDNTLRGCHCRSNPFSVYVKFNPPG